MLVLSRKTKIFLGKKKNLRFNFQGLFKKALLIQVLFKPVRTLIQNELSIYIQSSGAISFLAWNEQTDEKQCGS